ncbi:MAG: hypothetical protein QXI93_05440 [Candidatus Methanomethylicia archaeon]
MQKIKQFVVAFISNLGEGDKEKFLKLLKEQLRKHRDERFERFLIERGKTLENFQIDDLNEYLRGDH